MPGLFQKFRHFSLLNVLISWCYPGDIVLNLRYQIHNMRNHGFFQASFLYFRISKFKDIYRLN